MNNAYYGKTIENVRNHIDIKLATNQKEAKKWINKPNFKRDLIYHANVSLSHMHKLKVYLNKPRYIGATVLELAKLSLYEMFYDYYKVK